MKSPISKKLKSILEKGETQKVEFKESIGSGLDKEMVAFANSSGGKIYLGVTDKGKIKGINITNKLKSQIQNYTKNCDPEIPISIQEMKKEGILIITIKESKKKLHRCSSGFYKRVGSTSQKLMTEEIRKLMVKRGQIGFDDMICEEFDYRKDFDREKLFSFLDRAKVTYNRRNTTQLLTNLGVAKKQGSKVIFNNAGALFFSKNLKKIYFHTEISCGLFKGTEKVHVLSNQRFNKDLIFNVESAMDFLWRNLRARHELPSKSLRRVDVLEIPEDALREALVNAVTHRDYLHRGTFVTVEIYDDRVEISNFGGLPEGLHKREFGKKSVLRNPLIAELMLRARYIERMGTGIKKMRDLVKSEGLKPIKFELTISLQSYFIENLSTLKVAQ